MCRREQHYLPLRGYPAASATRGHIARSYVIHEPGNGDRILRRELSKRQREIDRRPADFCFRRNIKIVHFWASLAVRANPGDSFMRLTLICIIEYKIWITRFCGRAKSCVTPWRAPFTHAVFSLYPSLRISVPSREWLSDCLRRTPGRPLFLRGKLKIRVSLSLPDE